MAEPTLVRPPLNPIDEVDTAWVAGEAQELPEPVGDSVMADEAAEAGRRITRRPKELTTAERLAHEELHEPYRDWCRACVAGRGRVEYHRTRDHSEDSVPVLAIDYGYLSKRVQEGDETAGQADSEFDENGVRCSPILCGISS